MKAIQTFVALAVFACAVDYAPVSSATGAFDLGNPALCTIVGKAKMYVPVYSAASGGTVLLNASNHERNIRANELPADTATGRIRVRASRDVPGIRIDGYVASKTFTFSAAADQPVVPDHVWLRSGASLRLYQSTSALEGDAFASPLAHTRTRIECADLRFGTTPAGPQPKGERVLFRTNSTPLFASPAGKQVFTIDILPNEDVTVFAVKTQGVFRKIEVAEDVKVSGWVRAADLDTFGAGPGYGTGTGTLGGSYAKKIQTEHLAKYDTEIYLGPGTSGPVVGILEKNAHVYQTPVANGYSTFTFVERDAQPPDGKEFHVLTSALAGL
jgi:hypothetical protein